MPSVAANVAALWGLSLMAVACAATVNKTDTYLRRVGVSFVQAQPAPAGKIQRGAVLRDAPGEDVEPHGFPIYDSIHDIPPYVVTNEDALHAKCTVRESRQVCLKGAMCGYVCEQILLAVQSFCAEEVKTGEDARAEGGSVVTATKWRTCEKARKYNKCSPKVCYRRTAVQGSVPEVLAGSVPEPHAVNSTFAIVRYKKPEPRYEREARRNRQTATISVILR